MGANVTVYCLEKLTDYFQFERLCHDLMALEGYKDIEPLGGFSDKGRDAIHVQNATNTVFAYSVREDWKIKLIEDANKVRDHEHDCDELVFITTAEFSASARDQAVKNIKENFGWNLKLYGVERLRILIETTHPEVRQNHQQIFPPDLLQFDQNYQQTDKEHIYIIYSPADAIFAGWLSQKMMSFGYRVWCDITNNLSNEDIPDDIDAAIESQSAIVLSILSIAAIEDMEHTRQRSLALRMSKDKKSEHLIAIKLDENIPTQNLDIATKALRFVDFSSNWGEGLENLQRRLEKLKIPQPLLNGKSLAARAFNESDVINEQEETAYLNCYEVLEIPKAIRRFISASDIDYVASKEIQHIWAHRRVDEHTFLSFFSPPKKLIEKYSFLPAGGGSTSHTDRIDKISVNNLISELLKKSMYMKCIQMGLQYCTETELYYFPFNLLIGNRLSYSRPDGTNTWVSVAGERKYWAPGNEEYYCYQLSPNFYVSQKLYANHVIMVRLRLRITNTESRPLPANKALSRRKHLTNDWWNKEWGDRFFAISHFLSNDGVIVIGSKIDEQIKINAIPTGLISPFCVNETQIDLMKTHDVRLWAGEIEVDNNDEAVINDE